MATAAYTTDLTDLLTTPDTGESTANWAALGGGASGLNVETDYFIQGANCISKNAWASDEKGMIEDTTLSTLSSGSGNAVYMWVTHLTPGSLATKANGGISILLGSSSTVYNEYDYAGSDTIDYGAPWICAVIDPDNATPTTGTVTTANIDCYGAQANLPTGGPTKGAPFGIDATRYGRSIEISGGDGVDDDATFTGLAAANDGTSARWGQFQRTPGSTTNFTMQCRVEFGKTSATSSACTFTDANKNITIVDLEYVGSDFIEFDVTQSSTVTISGCNFVASAGANTRGNWVTTNASSVTLDGNNFVNMGTFGFSSAYTVDGCVFRDCDQITQNSATITGCTIDGSTASASVVSTAATLSSLTGNTFVSDGAGHAVDIGTVSSNTAVTWDNTLDDTVDTLESWTGTAGSTTGVSGDADSALLVNVTGSNTLTITVADGASVPTVRNTGTGTVTILANTVTVSVTTVETDGTTEDGVSVVVETAAAGDYIYQLSTTSITRSGTTATATTASAHGLSVNDYVAIRGVTNFGQYNGIHQVQSVPTTTTFTYTIASDPGADATGTINTSYVFLYGTTSSGVVSNPSVDYSTDQAVKGTARKSSASPYFKPSPIVGTLGSNGFSATVTMVRDE